MMAQMQEQESFKALPPPQQQQLVLQMLMQTQPVFMQQMQQLQQLQQQQQQLPQQPQPPNRLSPQYVKFYIHTVQFLLFLQCQCLAKQIF